MFCLASDTSLPNVLGLRSLGYRLQTIAQHKLGETMNLREQYYLMHEKFIVYMKQQLEATLGDSIGS
jgi:hypothetical protein